MNWKSIRQAFKNPDMRKRIFYVFGLVVLFRFLAHVPIPLADSQSLQEVLKTVFDSQQLLGFLDLISGGALSNFSIMIMGLGPYINASIILQLLTKAVPKLEEISKDGESGRRKINQYTRILTLPLAIMQSIGLLFLIRQQYAFDVTSTATIAQWILMVGALVGGSMLLMWIGELMSEQGVGNGISLLIFAGIVSQMPSIIATLISLVTGTNAQLDVFGAFTLPIDSQGLIFVSGMIIVSLLVTYIVVKLNEAKRVITVSYAKRVRGNRSYGGVESVLPVKLITAGVIPIIFASAFLAVPNFLGTLLQNSDSATIADIGDKMVRWLGIPGTTGTGVGSFTGDPLDFVYPAVYFALVVMFTYFYTGITFSAKDIAENLQNQGGFIAGIRPGKQTEEYLRKVVNRLTLFGSTALALLAISPFFLDAVLYQIYNQGFAAQLSLGGTGLLIVVSVAIETLRQVESRALMITYDSE